MDIIKQKEIAKEWIKKSNRYISIYHMARIGTIALGISAMITIFFDSNIKLIFLLVVVLIALSQVWVRLESEWKYKKALWEKISVAWERIYIDAYGDDKYAN